MLLEHIATPLPQGQYVRPPKLNVYILDVSGSMGWACKQLAEDTTARIHQLPLHDAILVGIFSSPGWYRWIVARTLDEPQEYKAVTEIIQREVFARNTTCFSEILSDVPKAIKPFLAGYAVVSLVFMSDGCAVVPDLQREYAALDAAAMALKPFLTAGDDGAYGDYADRKTLTRLATNLGLEFLATDHIHTIGETFTKHATGKVRARRKVKVADEGTVTFAMEADGTVTPLTPAAGEVSVSDTADVYTLQSNGGMEPLVAQTPTDAFGTLYATALAMLRSNQHNQALDLLAALGDSAIVRLLDNALTNAEIATAEGMIQAAITDATARFTEGRHPGVRPPDDAFDLFDLLRLLMEDEECHFFPRHPAFRYKRIGRASKPMDGFPVFTAFDTGCSLAGMTGHASELNLSLRIAIPGSLPLPPSTKDGLLRPSTLPDVFPATIFRNYALVANALPVVTDLPVTMSQATYATLTKHGVIRHKQKYEQGRIEVLQLNRVPVCNKTRGLAAADWTHLATQSLHSMRLGAMLKVFRAKLDTLDPEGSATRPLSHTPEEYTFLAACGINNAGVFAPPTTTEPPTDVLDIRLFEVKPVGSSSVSIAEFEKMLEGKKKWTRVGEAMRSAFEVIKESLPQTHAAAVAWLHEQIQDHTRTKRTIDMDINMRRFAAALTGSWHRTFSSDTTTIMVGSDPVTLTFRTTTKKI